MTMVYDIFAKYSKGAAHALIEMTFPRNPAIALISAGVGYWSWASFETDGTEIIRSQIIDIAQKMPLEVGILSTSVSLEYFRPTLLLFANKVVTVVVVPYLRPYLSNKFGPIACFSTSFVLNQCLAVLEWTRGYWTKKPLTKSPSKEPIETKSPEALMDGPSDFVKDCILDIEEEKQLKYRERAFEQKLTLIAQNTYSQLSKDIKKELVERGLEKEKMASELQMAKQIYRDQILKHRLCGYCNPCR